MTQVTEEVTKLGQRVKEWRLAQKLTQVALAKGAGCRETNVQDIENGRYTFPKVCRKLRVFMQTASPEHLAQLRNFKKTPEPKRSGARRSRYAPHGLVVDVAEADEVAESLLRY